MIWTPLFAWLAAVVPSGTPVIRRDQDGVIPSPRPFVTAKAIADVREGQPSIGALDEDGFVLVQQSALVTVSIQTFGDVGGAVASAIRNSLEKESVCSANRAAGLVYVRVSAGPTDISEVVGTGFEQRYSLDVQFRVNVAILDDLGIIERVELTGTVGEFTHTEIIGVEQDGP